MHYIRKYLPEKGDILDNGAGPGKYAMELAKCGYNVTLTDITPSLVEMAQIKAKELDLHEKFAAFHVLNATNLEGLPNDYYDASLMLGPLYHLQDESQRCKAVKELYRVTKRDGVVFVAFMNRTYHVLMSLQMPEMWRPNDNLDEINRFYDSGLFNHSDEGRFTGVYFFSVEDIKPFMKEYGFQCIELVGSESIGLYLEQAHWQYWLQKGEQHKLIDLLVRTAKDPAAMHMSSHLLYIWRKAS